MLHRIIHFLKYNNFTVILLFLLLFGGVSVFAASPPGQEVIGQKETRIEGVDNTLLLELDLSKFDMGFKIENIEQDDEFYYITFTYLDLVLVNNAWQYQVVEKLRKVSKKSGVDVGEYMAGELKQYYEDRISYLRTEQAKAGLVGNEARTQVTEYSGLIGKTLDVVSAVFPNYENSEKTILPTPADLPEVKELKDLISDETTTVSVADNLTDIYNDYVTKHDPDADGVFNPLDNCPIESNADQIDADADGIGDACDDQTSQSAVEAESKMAPAISAESAPESAVVPGILPDAIADPNSSTPPSQDSATQVIELPQ